MSTDRKFKRKAEHDGTKIAMKMWSDYAKGHDALCRMPFNARLETALKLLFRKKLFPKRG